MADVVTKTVDLSQLAVTNGGSRQLSAYVAHPAGTGPWPGVVMVMEIFGVNADMRAHAERIASWGYSVVVPDLYSDGGARRCWPRQCVRSKVVKTKRLSTSKQVVSGCLINPKPPMQ